MRRATLALWLSALGSLLGACGGSLQTRATLLTPAELPLRVFPEIVVVASDDPLESDVADALARTLARGGRSRVLRVDARSFDRLRERGELGAAAGAVLVEADVVERARARMSRERCLGEACDRMPEPMGPVVSARLTLRVIDPRTGEPLQALALEEVEEGDDLLSMRARALARLQAHALSAVDETSVPIVIELLDVDDEHVRAALEAATNGDARRARTRLDAVARQRSFASRPDGERARVLFDLGQAWRLDAHAAAPHDDASVTRLARARAALGESLRIAPSRAAQRALVEVERERVLAERARGHAEMALHNFALDARGAMPPPPESYTSTR